MTDLLSIASGEGTRADMLMCAEFDSRQCTVSDSVTAAQRFLVPLV